MCVTRAGIGAGLTAFSLTPLRHRDLVSYRFETHDERGQLTYQNIDLVIRGNPAPAPAAHPAPRPTQFLHARGGRRGVVRLGRGNDGLYVSVRSFSDWAGWRFRACLVRK